MTILHLADQTPFTTRDGSTIRSILDRTNAPVEKQSLAEARVPAGGATLSLWSFGDSRALAPSPQEGYL